ncbi:hypothetical protein [Maridesulfovibrio sp.]|uniref:hypothetical protein n=1 Tax=Maridesulfovibrio sp. TaxID=2795000 RepID=UPI003AFFFC8E
MRNELIKKIGMMSEQERLDLFELQLQLIRNNMQNFKSGPELSYATLIEALSKRIQTEKILSRKGAEAGQSQRLMKMRIDSMLKTREGVKERTFRKRYFGLVKDLRGEVLGWRKCSEYLKKHHKFTISFSHLKTLFLKYSEIESVENQQGGTHE